MARGERYAPGEVPGLDEGDLDLLRRLIRARGPSGAEGEVRDLCREVLAPLADTIEVDPAGNLVCLIRAGREGRDPIVVAPHLDEIAMQVKRVEEDGTLSVVALGGVRPMSFGQCAVDVIGDGEILRGAFSLGSLHRSGSDPQMSHIRAEGPGWDDVFVMTGLSRAAVEAVGVHAGSFVVISAEERHVVEIGDCLGAHFMDDRALILAGVLALRTIKARREALDRDLYFVLTVQEEVTNAGALYAAHTLPGTEMLALEVGPVAREYGTRLSADPIVSIGDQKGLYSPEMTADLRRAIEAAGYRPQVALLDGFLSDASAVGATGLRPRTAVIGLPTQNTHGFEVIDKGGIEAVARSLERFLLG